MASQRPSRSLVGCSGADLQPRFGWSGGGGDGGGGGGGGGGGAAAAAAAAVAVAVLGWSHYRGHLTRSFVKVAPGTTGRW